jgi:hypothetical protein
MKRLIFPLFGIIVSVCTLDAHAEGPASRVAGDLVVSHARLTVADVVKDAPETVRDVELGPAPSPGASRIVSRDEIVRSMRRAGKTAEFAMPQTTRITRASEHLPSRTLAEIARPAITATLPSGVTLTRVEATSDFTAPAGTRVGQATLPKLPKAKGPFHTTASVELMHDDVRIALIPMAVVLEISEAAAAPDVRKGAHVTVVVERATLRVSTEATVMKDSDVGDSTMVTLSATGRQVKVKIVSRSQAELVEGVR